MGKLLAFFQLFRRGSEVADPAAWKRGQVTANTVFGFLAALLATSEAFGYTIPIDDGQLAAVAGGVFALGNVILTIITTSKIGLPAHPAPDGEAGPAAGASPAQPERAEPGG